MQVEKGAFKAVIPKDCSLDAPLIVILGWAGAQDKSLVKYADLLSIQGYPTVRSVLPLPRLFSPHPAPRRWWAENLLSFIITQPSLYHRPLIFYAFSNGGAFVLEQISHLVANTNNTKLKQQTLAFIYDSAPAYMHPGTAKTVLKSSMPPGLSLSLALSMQTLSEFLSPIVGRTSINGKNRSDAFWDTMIDLHWGGKPQLYLYSADDPLCDGAMLDQLVEKKKMEGQRVLVKRWEQSGHCAHLRHHPVEYSNALGEFLNSIVVGKYTINESDAEQSPLLLYSRL